tara:strand:- start:10564 stop:11163 length:600 start_codon:yes stop_codon:yes gene_type:complete
MRISHKNKWIFLSSSRTGSTSTRKALDKFSDIKSVHYSKCEEEQNPFYNHISLREIQSIFKHDNIDFKSYTTFTAVRNPWDRALSLYFHSQQIMHNPAPTAFSDWIKKVQARGPLYGQIYNQCLDDKNQYAIDSIIRFEYMQKDFNVACDKIGIPRQQLPHANATKHKHYTEYYNYETHEIVAEKYAKDIEYFGYEFGD